MKVSELTWEEKLSFIRELRNFLMDKANKSPFETSLCLTVDMLEEMIIRFEISYDFKWRIWDLHQKCRFYI